MRDIWVSGIEAGSGFVEIGRDRLAGRRIAELLDQGSRGRLGQEEAWMQSHKILYRVQIKNKGPKRVFLKSNSPQINADERCFLRKLM